MARRLLKAAALAALVFTAAPTMASDAERANEDSPEFKARRCNLAAETYISIKRGIAQGKDKKEMESEVLKNALDAGYDEAYAKSKIKTILPLLINIPFLMTYSEEEMRQEQAKRCKK